jgi:hypothetical protein
MMPFLVVPTLGNRPSLWPLLRDADMPAVVVWTNPDESIRPEVALRNTSATIIIDRGPINIHRWWGRGIDAALYRGADSVVISNDDVRAAPGALRKLAEAVTGRCALAYPDVPGHQKSRCTAITGWCFAIDPLRLREPQGEGNLRWWWGEHDIELRAQTLGDGSVKVVPNLEIEHLRKLWDFGYDRHPEISPIIEADRKIFNNRWAWKMGVQ